MYQISEKQLRTLKVAALALEGRAENHELEAITLELQNTLAAVEANPIAQQTSTSA